MARGTCPARRRRVADKDRKRVARACDLCRQQKEKCQGGIPCMRCVRLQRECRLSMWHESDHRIPGAAIESQSPQPQGQSQPATVEKSDDQALPELSQRLFYLEKIVRHKFGAQDLSLQALQALSMEAEQQDESASSAENEASCRRTAAVDDKCSIQPVEHTVAHFSGEFSHWNFSMQIKRWVERNVSQNARVPVEGLTEFWRSKDLQCLSSTLAAVSSLPPRFIADFLIHCFYEHAMTNYFYVDRDWLVMKLDKAYASSASLGRNDAGTICTIFGILAIGTHYAHLEAKPGDTGESMTNHPSNPTPSTGESASLAFYHQACRLLPDVITIASLESVQACLVLGVFALPLDASGLAWTYLGLAVKLAVLNGMHKSCPEGSFDLQTRESRNRLWWTVCSLERRVGIFHGRPPSICRFEMEAGLAVDQHNGVTGAPPSLPYVEATFHLNRILSRLAREISSLKGVSSTEALHCSLDQLSRSHGELVAWWNGLPSSVSRPEDSPSFSDIRPSAHLKLEYCLVRMFTGRIFLFPEGCLGSTDCRRPGPSASPSDINGLKSHLVADCVDAALGAIETCGFLRNTIGLARASYTEFSSCRAALLVITAQCFQAERGSYRYRLREGLTMLKEMATWAELARTEAALIDAFEQVLTNIDAIQISDSGEESRFIKFKRWENTWKENSSGPGPSVFSMARQDNTQPQITEPMWQDWPNLSESTSLNLGNLAAFPTPEHCGEKGPVHLPQACEDLSTLLGFSFQSS